MKKGYVIHDLHIGKALPYCPICERKTTPCSIPVHCLKTKHDYHKYSRPSERRCENGHYIFMLETPPCFGCNQKESTSLWLRSYELSEQQFTWLLCVKRTNLCSKDVMGIILKMLARPPYIAKRFLAKPPNAEQLLSKKTRENSGILSWVYSFVFKIK